jgi:hypothetical protein
MAEFALAVSERRFSEDRVASTDPPVGVVDMLQEKGVREKEEGRGRGKRKKRTTHGEGSSV